MRTASSDSGSTEAYEPHVYLAKCFFEADTDYDGIVGFDGFNTMVSEAATVPRRFGFAPHSRELYKDQEEYEEARKKLFDEVRKGSDTLSLEMWLAWARPHAADYTYARWEYSRAECITFFKGMGAAGGATHYDTTLESTQLKEFYVMCQDMFVKADVKHIGLLGPVEFKALLSQMSEVTHRFGLDWYTGVKFADVVTDDGVTWHSWFNFNVKLVTAKASTAW